MRPLSGSAWAAVIATACLSACTAVDQNASSLVISVTFAGDASCSAVGVDTLAVSAPEGDFATQSVSCSGMPPEIQISPLSVGVHRVQVNGLAAGTVIYAGASDVQVAGGGTDITMNLAAVATGNEAEVTVSFAFAAPSALAYMMDSTTGMSCSEAGAVSISYSVDGAAAVVVPCTDPSSSRDATIVSTTAGNHNFAWQAFSAAGGGGTALYSVTNLDVPIQAGDATAFVALFEGLSDGAFQVTWEFDTSGAATTCAAAGVAKVGLAITDESGNPINNGPSSPQPCSTAAVDFSQFPAGVYLIMAQGLNSSGTVTYSLSSARVYAPAGGNAMFSETFMPVSN
jgi:hypothetical protein